MGEEYEETDIELYDICLLDTSFITLKMTYRNPSNYINLFFFLNILLVTSSIITNK